MALSTGAGSYFQGSSSATGGTSSTGGKSYGNINFGSMATGIDPRWLIGAGVIIAALIVALLVWG